MCLTYNEAFIRFVGANYLSNCKRLRAWVYRLKEWSYLEIKNRHFLSSEYRSGITFVSSLFY